MDIFLLYLNQNFIKIYSKTHQIGPYKNISRRSMPPDLPNKCVVPLCVTQLAQTQIKSCPPPLWQILHTPMH